MLSKDDRRRLSEEFALTKNDWYIRIKCEIFNSKRNLLLVAYSLAILVPLAFLLADVLSGEYRYFVNYLIPLGVLLCSALLVFFLPESDIMIHVTILIAFAGFFLGAYLPQSRQVSIFVLISFMPFAFSLAGLRQGVEWSLLFAAGVVGVGLASEFGVLPPWNLTLDVNAGIMLGIGIAVNLVLMIANQNQTRGFLGKLFRYLIFDESTGLPNKNTLLNSIPADREFILAIVDISNFSEISSLFGYEVAENILFFAANEISVIADRDGYRCYKLIGHEFAILMPLETPDITTEETEQILHRIWFDLQTNKMICNNTEIRLNYRIGAAVSSMGSRKSVLTRADVALQLAARLMHNVYVHKNTEDEQAQVIRNTRLYSVLYDNIRNRTLKTMYQPIVDTESGAIRWFEALLRVKLPDGTYDSIYDYLPVARNTGIYNELTKFILSSAREVLLKSNYDISVNITLSDINHPGFMQEVIDICTQMQGRPNSIILEIVESEELIEIDLCREFIRTVQELGGKIAIDDFGSGYSNFVNILKLSVDIVKIDGSLIKSVEHDPNAQYMIESISAFCHNTGKAIVAEYIESEYLRKIVQDYRIHFSQGYLFGCAMEEDSVVCVEEEFEAADA